LVDYHISNKGAEIKGIAVKQHTHNKHATKGFHKGDPFIR